MNGFEVEQLDLWRGKPEPYGFRFKCRCGKGLIPERIDREEGKVTIFRYNGTCPRCGRAVNREVIVESTETSPNLHTGPLPGLPLAVPPSRRRARYECPICGRGFDTAGALASHAARTHGRWDKRWLERH